jgi:hypothetical protein
MTANEPTNQPHPDDHFEEQLRGFRPVAPQALAIPRRRVPRKAMAVAAGVLLTVGAFFVMDRHQHPAVATEYDRHTSMAAAPSSSASAPLTLGRLNRAWRDNDKDLNQMLDSASSHLLPRPDQGTALFELGKD